MIRIVPTQVQARMSCDHPGCGRTIRLTERPPGLTQDASDIREFHLTASILGWFIDEDNYDIVFCPNHTPTKENQ